MYGKPSPKGSGFGKGGVRKDIGHYVRSTWEANVCRIFKYMNRDYKFESKRFKIVIDKDDIYFQIEIARWAAIDTWQTLSLNSQFFTGIDTRGYLYIHRFRLPALFYREFLLSSKGRFFKCYCYTVLDISAFLRDRSPIGLTQWISSRIGKRLVPSAAAQPSKAEASQYFIQVKFPENVFLGESLAECVSP